MADINIEKKPSSIWPWLLGLVLLAAVAFAAWTFLVDREDTLADEDPAMQTEPYQTPPAPAATTPEPATEPPASTTTGL